MYCQERPFDSYTKGRWPEFAFSPCQTSEQLTVLTVNNLP